LRGIGGIRIGLLVPRISGIVTDKEEIACQKGVYDDEQKDMKPPFIRD
jgi:hypothetical protein